MPVRRGYILSEMDRARRDIINQIMCFLRVDLGLISQKYGLDWNFFEREVSGCRKYEADGLVEIEGQQILVPDRARPALRLIASCFDEHLDKEKFRHAMAM